MIYNTYLAPSSQCERNIDHNLRNELAKYLEDVVTNLTGKSFSGRVEPEQANAFNATQLQNMIRLYERIQTHVFRLMATDSVPKVCFPLHYVMFVSQWLQFIKTPRFLALKIKLVEEDDGPLADFPMMSSSASTPTVPPGLEASEEEVGGAYVTISQRAAIQERSQTAER